MRADLSQVMPVRGTCACLLRKMTAAGAGVRGVLPDFLCGAFHIRGAASGGGAGRFAKAVAKRPWRQGGLLPQSRSRLPERGRKVFPCRAHWECGAALRRPAGRIRILNGRHFLFWARPGLLHGVPRKGRKVIRDFCGAARAALVSRRLPAAGRGSRSFPQAPEARPFQASLP